MSALLPCGLCGCIAATPAEVAALRAELAEMTEAKNAHITFQNHNAKLVQARDDEVAALRDALAKEEERGRGWCNDALEAQEQVALLKREVERLRGALERLMAPF